MFVGRVRYRLVHSDWSMECRKVEVMLHQKFQALRTSVAAASFSTQFAATSSAKRPVSTFFGVQSGAIISASTPGTAANGGALRAHVYKEN